MSTASRPPLSPAAARNAALRAAVRAAHPGVSFTVRNGKGGWAAITWVDGPTPSAVEAVAAEVASHWCRRSGTELHRRVTGTLVAAGYLRARRDGRWFYDEVDRNTRESVAAGDVRPCGDILGHCAILEDSIDGASITPGEITRATLLLRLTGITDPSAVIGEVRFAPRQMDVARTLFHHGDVLDAVLDAPEADVPTA